MTVGSSAAAARPVAASVATLPVVRGGLGGAGAAAATSKLVRQWMHFARRPGVGSGSAGTRTLF